jgi:hypothetical protein
LRRKHGVYRIANATVYRVTNTEDAAEVEEPNPSQRSPKPNTLQSPMTTTKIATKCFAARHSIAPCADIARSTASRTEDFVAAVVDGFESESKKMGDERI